MAAFDESASDSGAESRGRSGDEHDHCSSLVGKRERSQAYFQCGAAARMNQPYKRLWQGRGAGSGRAFIRLLRAARTGAITGCASARRAGRKPVAYSILFQ
jgi:hypothetical protein